MRFSILIPTLNEENYIGHLLQSLADQTHKDFEVILVDGKSTDKTISVVKKFINNLKLKIIVAPHKGVSYQRNLAAAAATSSHLVFFDADTVPPLDFLEKLAAKITSRKIQFAYSWLNPISHRLVDKLIFYGFNLLILEPSKYFYPAGTGVFLYVWQPAFKHVHGFNESITVGEDYDLCYRLLKSGFKSYILRHPAIPFSVRRLDKDGRRKYLAKMLVTVFYYLTPKNKNKLTAEWYKFGHYNQ